MTPATPGCPDPARCPVVTTADFDLRRLRLHTLRRGTDWWRVSKRTRASDFYNHSGRGGGRFSPLAGYGHSYVAANGTVAMLETVFHEVTGASRNIYPTSDLIGRGLYRATLTAPVSVLDLRDDRLADLGIPRSRLAASPPTHYACTRALSADLIDRVRGGRRPTGIIWNSRIAEVAQSTAGPGPLWDIATNHSEVVVLLRPDAERGDAPPAGTTPVHEHLESGAGYVWVERIAESLDATIHRA